MAPGAVDAATLTQTPSAEGLKTKASTTTSATIQAALDAATARFVARNPRSKALQELAVTSLPGGNTRTALFTAPFPVYMKSGKDYQVTSEDGHTYTDLVGELTAGLYGHSRPEIIAALKDVLDNVGLNLGSTVAQEHVHAQAICERFGLDRVRFANSGTEANLHCLAGARAFTGKRKVVVFNGGYHGGVFSFGGGVPARNNVDLEDWIVARYNDVESAKAAINSEGVAAVIVEGMQGASGALAGTTEFLQAIEAAAKEAGVLFILDEVMTSRVAPGGIAELRGLKPDLKTFGKYLGGGLAFGAFGGRADVMSLYDPRQGGSLAHSGTFNNNTLVLAAGHAGLSQVYTPDVCTAFNALGDAFHGKLAAVTAGTKLCFTGVGAVLGFHFTNEGLQDIVREGDAAEITPLKDLFWYEMMEEGFWIVRRGNLALILGTPAEELDRFVQVVAAFLVRHRDIVAV